MSGAMSSLNMQQDTSVKHMFVSFAFGRGTNMSSAETISKSDSFS